MPHPSQSTDLAGAIRAERDRMASAIESLRAQDAACGQRITEISQMRPGAEELVEILEHTARLLREQALLKLRTYLEPVIRGDADYAARLPANIVNHSCDPQWHVSEFFGELPLAEVNAKDLATEVMAYAGWQSPPLNRAERQQQLAALKAEREALRSQLTALKNDCERLGLAWPG